MPDSLRVPSDEWVRVYREGPSPMTPEDERERAELHSELIAAKEHYATLRRDVLDQGGWGPSRDYSRVSIPSVIFRRHGEAPDVLALLLGYDEPDELLDDFDRRAQAVLRCGDAWRRMRG